MSGSPVIEMPILQGLLKGNMERETITAPNLGTKLSSPLGGFSVCYCINHYHYNLKVYKSVMGWADNMKEYTCLGYGYLCIIAKGRKMMLNTSCDVPHIPERLKGFYLMSSKTVWHE